MQVRRVLLLFCGLLLYSALSADLIYVINSESRTLSRIDTQTGVTDNVFAMLGLVPNMLCLDENNIYITCSGDNAVQVLDRETGQHLRYISVASSANPWSVIKHGNNLYVSGFMTNKVYRIDLQTNSMDGQVAVGISPEGMAIWDNKLYVANSGGWASDYAESSVSVIDLETFTVLRTLPVFTNPQALTVHGDYIHVSCTGNWTTIPGRIDIIDAVRDEVVSNVSLGGNPGPIWIDDDGVAHVGDGMSTGFYRYDAESLSILNGTANPLSPGGIALTGNQQNVYVLRPNWGANGRLYRLNRSYQLQEEYTIGLVPTDLAVYSSPVGEEDDVLPVPSLKLYPNPVDHQGILRLETGSGLSGTVEVYNLRGQRVLQTSLQSGKSEIPLMDHKLSSGIYLYRVIVSGQEVRTGKLVITSGSK